MELEVEGVGVHGRGGLGRRLLRGVKACPRSACPCPALEAFWLTEVAPVMVQDEVCVEQPKLGQPHQELQQEGTSVNQNASRAGHGHAERGHALCPRNSRRPRPPRP